MLGGPSDTWGRTWTRPQLGDAVFQVRLIDASNRATEDFELDYLAVTVAYVP